MRLIAPLIFFSMCGCGGGDSDSVVAVQPGEEVPCPTQTEKTVVLFTAGQSNAGNYHEQTHSSDYGARVVNFYSGKCVVAKSPLLGATSGIRTGESWTLLGNKLIAAGADQVVIIATAVGGSAVARWAPGGDLSPSLLSAADSAQLRYKITNVIWHQGETDFDIGTSSADYAGSFHAMTDSLRAHGITAPIFISVATRCAKTIRPWSQDNEISEAQKTLPDPAAGIYAGVDTDALVGLDDRYDGCHFGATGQEKFATAMAAIIKP